MLEKYKNSVINLKRARYQQNPHDAENGIGVEVSIWSRDARWFDGIEAGDEIVVLGLWKAAAGAPEVPEDERRFKTYTTNKLSLTLSLMSQLAKIPRSK